MSLSSILFDGKQNSENLGVGAQKRKVYDIVGPKILEGITSSNLDESPPTTSSQPAPNSSKAILVQLVVAVGKKN